MTNLGRGEAADDYLDARRRYGPDSPEAEQAAEALEQLLKRPEESTG
ncbi:hypothetical protein ACWEKM_24870 [Streptomyces sp. NPDC004752]